MQVPQLGVGRGDGDKRGVIDSKEWKGHQVGVPGRVEARWNWVLKGMR